MEDNTPPRPTTVAIRSVLPTIGFTEDRDGITEQQPAFGFKGGGIAICVSEQSDLLGRRHFLIAGHTSTSRAVRHVESFMPLQADSREQALAWLVYAIGKDFLPSQPIEWFERGRTHQYLLPWEQDRKRRREAAEELSRRRQARPHCLVPRDWMRLLVRDLRADSKDAGAQDECDFEFDGQMLRVTMRRGVVGVPAQGPAPWSSSYRVRSVLLSGLPGRLMSDPVEIGLWDGQLEVGRCRFPAAATNLELEVDEHASEAGAAPSDPWEAFRAGFVPEQMDDVRGRLRRAMPLDSFIYDLANWDIHIEDGDHLSDDWLRTAVFGDEDSLAECAEELTDLFLDKVAEYDMDYDQHADPEGFATLVHSEAQQFIIGWRKRLSASQ